MDSSTKDSALTPPVSSQDPKDEKPVVKKRTKTGCTTCRNRRIKCDETKPECNNCIKSKRQCGGYGIGSVNRAADGSSTEGIQRKSRRYTPYGDTSRAGRTYKNIVPAPPKEMDHRPPSPVVPTLTQTSQSQSPKRKREDEIESPGYFERPLAKPESPTIRSLSLYRYGDASRISISSLLTVDQATIAAYASQQSLSTYIPNYHSSSPLEDPIIFHAFRHYVEVVAPAMSLVESSPPNPSILNHHVIPSMKACNLFTYQLPVMAVSGNWAIMEAILAISFLHLSHVTRSSKSQAFLHYQLAVKRLQIESSRINSARDLCLLSATLLLAWYELATGDHLKWVRHMGGAKTMLVEFGSSRWSVTPEAAAAMGDKTVDSAMYHTDAPNYETANQPLGSMRAVTDNLQISTGRVLLYELFYLYAKMDVIQALVRGAPPLLDLFEWRYPLRGPLTTILGLSDALLHLMGRLAAFISTDRERKKNQEDMPPPSTRTPHPSHLSPPSNSSTPTSTWSHSSSHSSQTDPQLTPELATNQPVNDWEALEMEFQTWKRSFNNVRKVRVEPNMPTPFGPAIIYSDLRVAAAEMLFLAAQIHLSRAHPSTPSSVPSAIQMMAPHNGPKVAEIMRIQEGLWDSANFRKVQVYEDGRKVGGDGSAVDHVVSALSNSAWPMLVGGVQVRSEEQRKWMKKRLCDIYELSGFATAMRVRKGLEIAWGHRVRGEPTAYADLDSDDETDLSLLAHEQREQARELKQRRPYTPESGESRFVLVRDGERYLGEDDPEMYAHGLFGGTKRSAV